ncbi:MAG: hypothetical protein M3Z96_10090 [Pseudomonadota bacterium]|nr:hypothetical protein [Pseudomonadota bacterium]
MKTDASLDTLRARPRGEPCGRTTFTLSLLAGTLFLLAGLHPPYFPVWLAARGFPDSEVTAARHAAQQDPLESVEETRQYSIVIFARPILRGVRFHGPIVPKCFT